MPAVSALLAAMLFVAQDTVPPGYGTLKRDDIVVRFATGTVEIQCLPLDEQVIRLLATDTYQSLTQLIKARTDDVAAAADRAGVDHPTLVLVTFYGLVPQARFNPEDLNISSRGGCSVPWASCRSRRRGAPTSSTRDSRRSRSTCSRTESRSASPCRSAIRD